MEALYSKRPSRNLKVVRRSRKVKAHVVQQVAHGLVPEETISSCNGCPLLPPKHATEAHLRAKGRRDRWNDERRLAGDEVFEQAPDTKRLCYAYMGQVWGALLAMQRAIVLQLKPGRLAERATLTRYGMIGCPSSMGVRAAWSVVRAGIRRTCYLAQWMRLRSPVWKRFGMASCHTAAETREALERGWRPCAVVSESYKGASTIPVPGTAVSLLGCPAAKPGATVTCADCALCDPDHVAWKKLVRQGIVGIGIPAHQ